MLDSIILCCYALDQRNIPDRLFAQKLISNKLDQIHDSMSFKITFPLKLGMIELLHALI